MQPAAPTIQKFRWRWIVVGVLANAGALFAPAYNWEGQPISTWLTLVLFPYGMLWSDWAPFYHYVPLRSLDAASRFFFFLAPFPIYGFVLALAARGRHLRLCCYSLLILHTCVACIAAMRYYRYYR
jgi:hypothetical protein